MKRRPLLPGGPVRAATPALGLALGLTLSLAPDPARADPPPMQLHRCPNGLEVLVVENHALPLFTVEIAFKNGSMTEAPDYNGLSHLYEHMFFKSNAAIPSQEAYMARARELGMQWNGTTNTERVNYFFTTTSDHLNDAMVFMRDAVVSPLFEQKELERERVVVTGEIDRNEANPNYHLFRTVGESVWWKYPSYKIPIGDRKTVLSATTEKMRTIQSRYYIPNNGLLVVTGDVKAADVFAQADTLYSSWKAGPDPFIAHPLVKHPPIPKTSVVVIQQPVQTVTGMMTWHGPSTVGKDVDLTYAADLLGFALQMPASKFQKALVDSGACLHAGLSWLTARNVGPITLSFEATQDKVDTCIQTALAELPKLKGPDYLSDEELKNAVRQLEADQVREREKPSDLAHTLSFWWCSASLDYYKEYAINLAKADRNGIARFLDSYVLGHPFVLGTLVSPEMATGGHLDQAHFASLIGIDPGAEKAADPKATKAGSKAGSKAATKKEGSR